MSYLRIFAYKFCPASLLWLVLIPLAGAQNDPAQSSPGPGDQPVNGTTPSDQTVPAPAFGAAAVPSAAENPPISALDQPSLEPGALARSFLVPGAIVSESADSNINGTLDSQRQSNLGGITRLLGSLTLQRLWPHYETDLQYVGGGAFYEGVNRDFTQMQQAEAAQRIVWRTGQLALRDSVSYLPDGSFGGGSYGGSGALRAGLAGLGAGTGGSFAGIGSALGGPLSASQFGSVGQHPRLTNTAAADLVETLTPLSSITLAGSYAFVHFTGNSGGLVDSDQFAVQAGYDRNINRKDQIAVTYAFQHLHFPSVVDTSISTNVVNLAYGRRISGRMDMVIAAGPRITQIKSAVFGDSTQISASGSFKLHYRFTRASMHLEYKSYNTNGSGYFLGSNVNVGTLTLERPLGRIWDGSMDVGIANSQRLVPASQVVSASSDRYWFAGAAVHRHIGRRYRAFISYQYNQFSFNRAVCSSGGDCGKTSDRHMGLVGVEWYPRPIRLD